MNIAYLSTFYPYRGGIAQFNASLFRALERRHSVGAWTFTRQYPDFLFPGTTQYVTPEDRADPVTAARTLDSINPLSYLRTASAINARPPDLLLTKFWMSFFGPALGAVAARMTPATTVVSILDNVIAHEKRFFDTPFTKYFLERNDGFVVMSSAVEEDLRTLTGGRARYVRIPHPIYDHFGGAVPRAGARERLGIPAENRVVLFFGFIRDYKGLDLLIRAFGELDGRYTLLIAGEVYGSFERYRSLIDASPLRDNIRVFNDYIDDARVGEFFGASDVCVLPYRSATQSGITSIAYHFDVPVIATDVGGLAEDVGGRGTGIVAGPPDPSLIAAAVRRYFDDAMAEGCVKNIAEVKREENWDRFAEKLTAFTESL